MGAASAARAPGRVNLIGEHTDYNQGLALPVAIDRATTVTFTPDGSEHLRLASAGHEGTATVHLGTGLTADAVVGVQPPWARIAAGLLAAMLQRNYPVVGGVMSIDSDVPTGAGLSSSAALCVAMARALGMAGDALATAELCRDAEAAAGADVGLMDPLVSVAGQQGHGLLVDFAVLRWELIPIPEVDLLVVHSGVERQLARTPYPHRRRECSAAEAAIGLPLGRATLSDLAGLSDRTQRRRVRHVVTECQRVRALADALRDRDLRGAGQLMTESHRSQAEDFSVSTPAVDQLVATLARSPGVHGARMTGGGFGGCVIALAEPGSVDPARWGTRAWRVVPSGGAVTWDPSDGTG